MKKHNVFERSAYFEQLSSYLMIMSYSYYMQSKLSGIIIDDDHETVDMLSLFLDIKGYDVVGTGYNGCEAAILYEKNNPDFVILGMNMPHYDGEYAVKEIKKINPNANIFVVTGNSEYQNLENEVSAVILKPLELYEIVKAIETNC